jgi:two-component system chemotaxis response regulator CheY
VRVWAELGRTRLPSAHVVGMPEGSVVELDQAADEPIDLYVSGTPFCDRPPDGGRRHRLGRADRTGPVVREHINRIPDGGGPMARVLVVDDAAFMRKMVSDALTKGGHEVVGEAGNGAEAIARFQELKPEIMTLDITMPEKDGLTALKEIIELDPSARVIMCSALGQESKVLESIKLGAKDFVVKPFQADRVLDAVGKALA